MHLRELLERGADAQRALDTGHRHVTPDVVHAARSSGKLRWQCESTNMAAAARRRAGQIVCVGLADAMAVPRISSMRSFSVRVFSSAGKRTPTPCVRPPDALAGVIQATLPATG
jgi:hypothetical protein